MLSVRMKVTIPPKLKALPATARRRIRSHPAMRTAWRAVGQFYLSRTQRRFVDLARGQFRPGGAWMRISWMALLLRRRKGRKFKDLDAVDRAAAQAPILRDRGLLLNSLRPSGHENILRPGRLQVTVGTADQRATQHQHGRGGRWPGEAVMIAGADKINLTSNRRKSRKTPTGRKSKAKQNWNPDYFRARAILAGLAGKKIRRLPKRPIVVPLRDLRDLMRMDGMIKRGVNRALKDVA